MPSNRKAASEATKPLVSVGMSVHNCAGTVGAAIQSVINQSLSDWELILINDGSSDETETVCLSFTDPRIRYVSDGSNRGLHHRLNQAIGLSRGRYFARMDGDDVCFPNRFEQQTDYLASHSELDLISTPTLVIDHGDRPLGVRGRGMDHGQICAHPWRGFPLAHPAWMGKLEWFRRYLYSESAVRVEDQELLLRAYRHSRFAILDQPMLAYRDIDLFSARAARSRKTWSRVLIKNFFHSGNPMFLISGSAYGILSMDGVYRLLRKFKKPRTAMMEPPSSELFVRWNATLDSIKSGMTARSQLGNAVTGELPSR